MAHVVGTSDTPLRLAIVQAGEIHGTRRTASADAPEDLEAYACTLQFYVYRTALFQESHAAIRTCLEQAVARHPGYATAWAMLSVLYLDEDRFGFNPKKRLLSPTKPNRDFCDPHFWAGRIESLVNSM